MATADTLRWVTTTKPLSALRIVSDCMCVGSLLTSATPELPFVRLLTATGASKCAVRVANLNSDSRSSAPAVSS